MNYAYWLANIPGIGNRTIHRILSQVGSAGELYFMEERQIEKLDGLNAGQVQNIIDSRKQQTEQGYETLCGQGITFLSLEDASYPQKLRNIPDAPYGIYLKGRLPENTRKTAAIVGARMCSEYGHAVARKLGRELALHGVCVISGMARGIDSEGHWGALSADGMTCAVLGCGVDVCYPASGGKLYDEILKKGGILSEYPPGTDPLPGYFPARNRIISGLSDVVIVVEAKERSGSLITADCALEQGREIYAVPGRIYDPLSAGCNNLIRQGAGIISDSKDFLKELDLCGVGEACQENFTKLLLEKDESMVYSFMSLRPKSLEELLQLTGFAMTELIEILAKLEQKGFITETFKNYYIRRI